MIGFIVGFLLALVFLVLVVVFFPVIWLLTGGSLDLSEGHPWLNRRHGRQ